MAGACGRCALAQFIPGTVLLIGFALMMIATAIAMLRGRKNVGGHRDGLRLSIPKIVAEGVVVGPRHRTGRCRRRFLWCRPWRYSAGCRRRLRWAPHWSSSQ